MTGKSIMTINITCIPNWEHLLEEIKYITFRLGGNSLLFIGKNV